MEFLMVLLITLTVIGLIQLSLIKRRVQTFDIETLSLRTRLEELKREIEALVRMARGERGPAPEAKPEQPRPAPAPAVFPQPVTAQAMPPPLPAQPFATPAAAVVAPEPDEPAASIPATPPSALAASVRDILRKIWSWILVGEEHRQTGMTMEFAVATTWLMRAGIIAVVAFVGYFLMWSIEHELIGPFGRVALAIFFGLGLLLSGLKMINRRWNILGQGFMGGGLATLYFSMYAAGPLYKLFPVPVVFLLMIVITIAAGILAVHTRSMLVAIFGIIGGFCTPILLSTDHPQLPAFYGYLLLLNLGILGIAHFRQWRLLNYLGFVFTYVLFFASLNQYQRADFPVAITFLSLFFVVQSLLIILYNIRRAVRSSLLEIIHLVLNAAVFSYGAYDLIRDAVGRPYPALMTLALAAFYILQVSGFLRRRLEDRPLLISLIALAGFFASLTLPLVMEKESLTICWSLLAFMFIWLGIRLNSNFLRHLGYLMYGIVFFRLLFFEMPRNYDVLPTLATPWAVYGKALGSRLWTFGVAIASMAAAFFLERRQAARSRAGSARESGGIISPANDTPALIPASVAGPVLFWGAVVTVFIFLQLECYAGLAYYTPLRPAISTLLWCGLAGYFLFRTLSGRSPVMLVGLCVLLAVAVTKTLGLDLAAWQVCDHYYFRAVYTPVSVVMRWLDFASLLGLLFAAWMLLGRRPAAPQVFGYTGLALLFLFLTLETNSLLYWKLAKFQTGGISVLWALFAAAFIAGGIWKRVRPLRYIGLILFAVIVAKVFFVDLEHMPVIYKAVAFLVIGALLLLGSFAYLYASRQFQQKG
ncbi:MAG: DUF2339 domain-containing protein [Verrucomicrobia bacterium]|nr:DUF2339 domain-containing protein [Verrucomicrobiota bacterium]MBU4247249.1 DUF2339 domain-containing protein [Verrucomicrobiota bacterium]MBU4289945.1 DUF2339 domain-containing protein [Verrucomicrobiota bacterium]MBU4498060.1 DUF2339 domain-containing protein [Verrucomicrobiota bacterium]MCG2679707.1 DUF2339 domain-containing protein [Kiritimatiellia bacterium]